MRKFVYKIVNSDDKIEIRGMVLNEEGLAGWELISVEPIIAEGWTQQHNYYFKREL